MFVHFTKFNLRFQSTDLGATFRRGSVPRNLLYNVSQVTDFRLRDALDQMWPPVQENKSVLLHGDFWPGNIMWKDDQIVAVIDWEDADFGDRLSDFANARLEILMFFGIEAITELTRHYRSSMVALEYTNLPYWDLFAALRPAGIM